MGFFVPDKFSGETTGFSRLGRVLYAAGIVGAGLVVLVGLALLAEADRNQGEGFMLFASLAFLVYMAGRGLLYVFADE